MSEQGKKVIVYRRNILSYSETFIKDQVDGFSRWSGLLAGRLPTKGIEIDEERIVWLTPKRGIWRQRSVKLAATFLNLIHPQALRRLRAEGPALVVAHFGTNAIEAGKLARKLGVPLLVTLHGYDINTKRSHWESGKGGVWMRSYPRKLLDLAKRPDVGFVAVSEAIAQRARAFGIPDSKIAVRHIGIDIEKFEPGLIPAGEREPNVLFVGRLVEKKNCAALIRVISQMRAEVPKIRLTVVGDGPLRGQLEKLSAEIDAPVTFKGKLTPKEVAREFDQARAFCLPSVTADNGDAEGFGMVVLEAQASGVPVVTSALGGATEGVDHGVTGFGLVEKDDVSMRLALKKILTDDAFASSAGIAGRKFVEKNFNIKSCTASLEQFYDDFIQGCADQQQRNLNAP